MRLSTALRQRPLPYQPDPLPLLQSLLSLERPVLLQSADRNTRFGRYDILAAAPVATVTYADGVLQIGDQSQHTRNPLAALQKAQRQRAKAAPDQDPNRPPFASGFLGYLSYELHQLLENQAPAPTSPAAIPALWGGFYDWSIVTDHRRQTTTLQSISQRCEAQALSYLEQQTPTLPGAQLTPFQASLNSDQYQQAFAQTQRYIHAGDCYQVNFAQHYQARMQGHPLALYRDWLTRQPAPFCAYLGIAADCAVLSLSPERFVSLRGNRASVSPIKGTRGRNEDPTQDALARLALLRSDKDRAENLMIVDLLRNDLGRVAQPGSVRVTHLFEPLTFANVHHLVSTIEGRLRPHTGAFDLVKALFPCGSVTGAPKIRAIDIINELEPVGRSIYCGAIGYVDDNGAMDLSVAIRTALACGSQLHLWGGGGLVADSDVEQEAQEIEEKIGRLLASAND